MDPQPHAAPTWTAPPAGRPARGTSACTVSANAATTGTPFFRLKQAADLVTIMRTWLCSGCPRQAIVAALDVIRFDGHLILWG